jgi:hypothetical protein
MKPSASPSTPLSQQSSSPSANATNSPQSAEPVNIEEESVAGEEDPGAALDLTAVPPVKATSDKPER